LSPPIAHEPNPIGVSSRSELPSFFLFIACFTKRFLPSRCEIRFAELVYVRMTCVSAFARLWRTRRPDTIPLWQSGIVSARELFYGGRSLIGDPRRRVVTPESCTLLYLPAPVLSP
jgi:hypothetical protein